MSLLTIVEASKQFNVGRTAIYKAIKKGELTAQINHVIATATRKPLPIC